MRAVARAPAAAQRALLLTRTMVVNQLRNIIPSWDANTPPRRRRTELLLPRDNNNNPPLHNNTDRQRTDGQEGTTPSDAVQSYCYANSLALEGLERGMGELVGGGLLGGGGGGIGVS